MIYFIWNIDLETSLIRYTGEMQNLVGQLGADLTMGSMTYCLNIVYSIIKLSTDASFIKRTRDSINNGPSYRFACETNELYEDIADLLLQRR